MLTLDLTAKTLLPRDVITVDKAALELVTNVVAQFALDKSVVVGVNDAIFLLFQTKDDGRYQQTGIQPADLKTDEDVSVLEVDKENFITVGN